MTDSEVELRNDPNIADDDLLYRRIAHASSPDMITSDSDTGVRRPSSGVFKTSDADGISVYLGSILDAAGLTPANLLRAPNNAVCSLKAGVPREHDLGVVRDPLPANVDDPDHPRHGAHGLITGMNRFSSKRARLVARQLAMKAVLVIDPGAHVGNTPT